MTADRTSSVVVRPAGRRGNHTAVLSGVLVAVVVLVGGLLFWQLWPSQNRATSTLVVLPDAEGAETASYYDTLSSGQIAATFAQIVGLRAEDGAPAGVSVKVDVVPETSLIQVTATAEDAATAETEADAALERARPYFDQLAAPYGVFVVQPAAGTAEPTGLAPGLLGAVVAALALVAGLAAFLMVRGLQTAGGGRLPSRAPTHGRHGQPASTVPAESDAVRDEAGHPADGPRPLSPQTAR